MNKNDFIKVLVDKTGFDEEKCKKINDVLEDNFIIGKKNKDKIIEQLKSNVKLDDSEANNVYELCMESISEGIKDKLKHPFKGND